MIIKDAKLCLTAEDMTRALNFGLDSVLKDGFEVSRVNVNLSATKPYEIFFSGPVETKGTRK